MAKAKVKNDEELFFITRSFYCTYLNNSKKILHKITMIAQKNKTWTKRMVGWEQSFKYCTWVPTCVPILHLVPSGIYSLHITNTYNKSIIGKIHKRRVSHWALVFFSINWIAHKIRSIFLGEISQRRMHIGLGKLLTIESMQGYKIVLFGT